jgi:hypothetical protein
MSTTAIPTPVASITSCSSPRSFGFRTTSTIRAVTAVCGVPSGNPLQVPCHPLVRCRLLRPMPSAAPRDAPASPAIYSPLVLVLSQWFISAAIATPSSTNSLRILLANCNRRFVCSLRHSARAIQRISRDRRTPQHMREIAGNGKWYTPADGAMAAAEKARILSQRGGSRVYFPWGSRRSVSL